MNPTTSSSGRQRHADHDANWTKSQDEGHVVATKQDQSPRAVRRAAPLLGTFRAFWPITDESQALQSLIDQARKDLPWLTAQAHAQLAGRGKWSIERSVDVPGSGRVTETVLMYNAPAVEGRAPYEDSKGEVA